MTALRHREEAMWHKNKTICGIDEAGRGPLAGPCVVCGVVLKPNVQTDFIDDSKKLSHPQRRIAFELIQEISEQIYVEIVTVQEIDRFNIYRSTQMAMEKIANQVTCDLVLTDAMPLQSDIHHEAIIKGDHESVSIACASIIAKVIRDDIMFEYDEKFPEYGFKKHKGYPTKQHYEAIERHGILEIHRRSFKLTKQLTLF